MAAASFCFFFKKQKIQRTAGTASKKLSPKKCYREKGDFRGYLSAIAVECSTFFG